MPFLAALGSIPALRTLTPTALADLSHDSRPARYHPGTVIRPAGQQARSVVLLLAGTVVAAYTGSAGTQVWPARWDGPAVVDKPSILGGGIPLTALVATTVCAVRLLPPARFLQLLDEEPSVRRHVLGHLARDALAGRDQLALSATRPAVAQVAAWLLAHGAIAPATAWRGSQEELARTLGLSRVTVNRALRRLTQAGAVRRGPRGLSIVDFDSLGSFLD
jgi:CRP/FNR family cyclic AMP-dependent transcriptional regulator